MKERERQEEQKKERKQTRKRKEPKKEKTKFNPLDVIYPALLLSVQCESVLSVVNKQHRTLLIDIQQFPEVPLVCRYSCKLKTHRYTVITLCLR